MKRTVTTINSYYLRNKLGNKAGETISETLVALLISALALVMLAGAISAASHMVTNSRNRLNEYYDQNEDSSGVVMMMGGGNTGKATIMDSAGTTVDSAGVSVYTNDTFGDKHVMAYKKSE